MEEMRKKATWIDGEERPDKKGESQAKFFLKKKENTEKR